MIKLFKRIGIATFILFCLISLCSCDKDALTSQSTKYEPDLVAQKYVSAYYSGNWDVFLNYSVSEIDYSTIVQTIAKTFEKIGESEEDLSVYLIETFGTDNYEKAVHKAFEMYKNRWQDYQINISAVKQNYYDKDKSDEIVSDFNEEINEFFDKADDGTKKILSGLLVNPNDIESVCQVDIAVETTSTEYNNTENFDLYCVKIDNQWKVLEHQLYGKLIDCIDDF